MHSRCTALSYPVEDIVYNLLIELSYTSSAATTATTSSTTTPTATSSATTSVGSGTSGAEIGQKDEKPVLLKGLDKRLIEGRTRFIIPRDTLEEWLQEQHKMR